MSKIETIDDVRKLMKQSGVKNVDLARAMNSSEPYISMILTEKKDVTAKMAFLLGHMLGFDGRPLWMAICSRKYDERVKKGAISSGRAVKRLYEDR